MALVYETGTPSTIQDLVDKLQTFAAANGWTVDEFDTTGNQCTLHEGSDMYVTFAWDTTPATGSSAIAIYQSLGWTTSTAPDAMPDDSGNGDPTPSAVTTERRMEADQVGPYTAYYFFAQTDGTAALPKYINVVLQVSAGVYRHMQFGTIIKTNDWTGGQYAAGNLWNQTAAQTDNPASTSHYVGLDGQSPFSVDGATMHMEGVGDQGVNEKWGVFSSLTRTSLGTDTAGEARRTLMGGSRGGLWGEQMRHIKNSALNAYVPIIPIPVLYRDTLTVPDKWIWLGQQANVGIVNMDGMSAGDEFTLGGETWKVFPWCRKQFLQADTQESWNAGYAYRKS